MKNLTDSDLLEVIVEDILPFGVFVRLPDGRRGYIRRRELDLDADAEPSQVTHKGDRIKVVVLNLSEAGKDIELSRRETLKDPWPEFAQQFHVGDTVRGSVRALQPHGIFVRIDAGIEGFVSLEELSTKLVNRPEEVVWLGDDVEAIVTRLNPHSKHMSLSIKARMAQYDQALEMSRTVSKKSSRNLSKARLASDRHKDTRNLDATITEKVGPILVVEDNDHVRDSLTTWLSRMGFHVTSAKTVSQAMAMDPTSYKVFMVDLNLLEYDGLELIQHLRSTNNSANISVMSSPEMLIQRARDIETAQVMGVFPKPLDLYEVEGFLLRAARQEPLDYWRADPQPSNTMLRPATVEVSETQTLVRLQHAVADITSIIRAQTGLLFQLDPDSHAISIPVRMGKGQINPSAIYGLRESPVNDVIKGERPIFENRVIEKALPKFDKLLNLLSFGSCIGVPIIVQGEVHHAVFFFHSDVNAFHHSRLRDAQAGALLLSAILTEEGIQSRLSSLNPMLLSGELAASFGHDVFNKITALELESRNLTNKDHADDKMRAQKLLELVLDLKKTAQAFQQMLRTKEQMETVDASIVIQRAIILLKDFARKDRTQIVPKLASDLPSVVGNSIILQQAFLNIMLNAIQQMAQKAQKLGWAGKHILEVTLVLKDDIIQIRFKDNGPGIHKESLRKIFIPGFSTREGSGLGLYIARSFIQMMGGTLRVEETFVPVGTTFLVELPAAKLEA